MVRKDARRIKRYAQLHASPERVRYTIRTDDATLASIRAIAARDSVSINAAIIDAIRAYVATDKARILRGEHRR